MTLSVIAKAREARGLSQEQAAVAFGISSPTWRKYERTPEVMPIRTAARLANFLGITLDEILPTNRAMK